MYVDVKFCSISTFIFTLTASHILVILKYQLKYYPLFPWKESVNLPCPTVPLSLQRSMRLVIILVHLTHLLRKIGGMGIGHGKGQGHDSQLQPF